MVEALVSGESAGRDDDHLPAGDVVTHDLDDSVPRYVREVVVGEALQIEGERIFHYSRYYTREVHILIVTSVDCL